MAEDALRRGELARTGLVAATLAFAGLPLYVHAPRYYAEEMAVGLPMLGAVLLGARVIDSVQDPILGWLADRLPHRREAWALAAMALLVAGFAVLFAPPGWGTPLPRLALGLVVAFTGFSALQIALYDHGLALADRRDDAHTRVALWREAGGLGGICIAALAPAALGLALGAGGAYAGFVILFMAFAAVASGLMIGRWRASAASHGGAGSFRRALAPAGVRAMLAFGFVNALPTALTATLFLFFVSDVLEAEGHGGPMLLVFFAAAAVMAPVWAHLAQRVGRRMTLAGSMTVSIVAFGWASLLGPGDTVPFYLVALASGATLGADMTLAPAMLAARIEADAGRVFAIWTFLQKAALALAAGVALSALALAGYDPSGAVTMDGRSALSVAYAVVPCLLKLVAIGALAILPMEKEICLANS